MRHRHWKSLAEVCGALLIAGCGQGLTATPVSASEPRPAPAQPVIPLPGRTVVIDPGHNGGGAAHPDQINAQVPDGRGGTKPCNTTGTSGNDGYTEHEFNWDVGQRVRDLLAARGFHVVMSRDSDDGVGPCVDERGTLGNRVGAAAVVSIHADGASAGAHGFHVAYSSPALNDAQSGPSVQLATTLRDTMVGAGFTTSTYVGSDGMNPRADLAGLNFSEVPTALIECGNMRDPGDAALIESPDGRARFAQAIANAIVAYLG
ncbi:N-acetylmuramoyl-L-alanine amidase [Nocardia sp. CDC153]|uniref:N-acetylmuramoyl-L-alanine amidase n=1 Tax=Nocardia sp. CDC153 TaxID=3112167 RepID=UPI002DB57618|nr:N-acetylmuramoyl-L-alanine amidase [Nocardia sp. CDC153]MEC3952815.1 N-acetylmuramoyl-L-alanine amidase [Nocardia sp. CDC153]